MINIMIIVVCDDYIITVYDFEYIHIIYRCETAVIWKNMRAHKHTLSCDITMNIVIAIIIMIGKWFRK